MCRTITTKDIELARLEGYGASEHVKRYTTLGMGTDQGKTANVVALGVLGADGRADPRDRHDGFRPPYTPVTWGAPRGPSSRQDFRPKALAAVACLGGVENGAVFADAGLVALGAMVRASRRDLAAKHCAGGRGGAEVRRGLRCVDARQ
jgi:sarcosine oxidase subunit alpha